MEAGDFTPWLAENLDVLADELGLTLTAVGTEVPVGSFFLDIQAETDDGRPVIIENQLGRTDHGHLGQLLVYASGVEAAVVIWVAPEIRDEHRRALDWLNERTDSGVDFFGVSIGVVQISATGPRAPVFEVVSRPNAWQKNVKESTGTTGAGGRPATTANIDRQEFFREVLTQVVASHPNVRLPRPGRDSWISFASGPFGYWSISFDRRNRCSVEAFIDLGDKALNKALFDELSADSDRWASLTGLPLSWQRRDDLRSSRVAVQSDPVVLDDVESRSTARDWAVDCVVRMVEALDATLRLRAREMRDVRQ